MKVASAENTQNNVHLEARNVQEPKLPDHNTPNLPAFFKKQYKHDEL